MNNNIIYNLQFGFRQQYSISHVLINVTENIRKAFDDGNIGCGLFVALPKAFDTGDHQILLAKLNHYGHMIKNMRHHCGHWKKVKKIVLLIPICIFIFVHPKFHRNCILYIILNRSFSKKNSKITL